MVNSYKQEINNDKWDQFKKCDYDSYSAYIENFAPEFKKIFYKNLEKTRLYFEQKKHKDIDKYLYNPYFEFNENIGKLHRPLTCIAAYNACSNKPYSDIDEIFGVASTIENFQSAALIHDDIADCGEIRRNKPCLHKTIGQGLAINAGDFGLSAVVGAILGGAKNSSYSDEKILRIIGELVAMEYTTIEGQAMDLGWAKDQRYDISQEDYLVMAQKKTSFYSAAIPCVLGAICADASNDVIENLKKFGKKVGLAFQIKDDILNIVDDGNLEKNKDFRSDITEGKRTLIVVKTLELANANQSNFIKSALQSKCIDNDEINKIAEIMQNCGAIKYAKDFAVQMAESAKIHLDCLKDSQWKNLLLDMTNWAVSRFA